MHGPGPFKYLGQECRYPCCLVAELLFRIGVQILGAGLVPQIPSQYPGISSIRPQDTLHVRPETGILTGISQRSSARTLDPARVVHPGDRWMLPAELRPGVPHRIKKHEHGTNVVTGGDGQELVDPLLKGDRVLLPE